MSARRVIVESPYAGDVKRNVAYARLAMQWLLRQGMAPFASHLLYTQCLDDRDAADRELGIAAGMSWRHGAELTVAFVDFGISGGMKAGMSHARKHGQEVREVMLRSEMGEGDFADAMVAFESTAHVPTIDHPAQPEAPAEPPTVDPRQMTFEEAARVLHCQQCRAPIRTVGKAYRCSTGCPYDNRRIYGESLTERALDGPHEPKIGGA